MTTMSRGLVSGLHSVCEAGPSRIPIRCTRFSPSRQPICPPRHLIRVYPSRSLSTSSRRLNAVSTAPPLRRNPTNVELRELWARRNQVAEEENAKRKRAYFTYAIGAVVFMAGVTYASIPLYRAFCSSTGFGGIPITDSARFSADRLYTTPETEARKRITVHFQATSSDTLPWKFEPVTRSVKVLPGETALAFYRAKNEGPEDIIGIATYNMTPERIAPFFAKVECFCFEEQRIRAGEEVDLPVFFFIDRDIMDEPQLDNLNDVVLSYTFFKARRNDRGHAVPDAPDDLVLRSQGFDQYEHAPPLGARQST